MKSIRLVAGLFCTDNSFSNVLKISCSYNFMKLGRILIERFLL